MIGSGVKAGGMKDYISQVCCAASARCAWKWSTIKVAQDTTMSFFISAAGFLLALAFFAARDPPNDAKASRIRCISQDGVEFMGVLVSHQHDIDTA